MVMIPMPTSVEFHPVRSTTNGATNLVTKKAPAASAKPATITRVRPDILSDVTLMLSLRPHSMAARISTALMRHRYHFICNQVRRE